MGHTRESKRKNHERIVEIAARQFREQGLDGISIADLMKEAGLTHGGFYKHFKSRDELVDQALTSALDSSAEAMQLPVPVEFKTLVESYLSARHRDKPGEGCAVAALVNDVGRSSSAVRDNYTQHLEQTIAGIARLFGGECAGDNTQDNAEDKAEVKGNARAKAIVAFSLMSGALGLARAVSDDDLSDEILNAVRDYLISVDPESL